MCTQMNTFHDFADCAKRLIAQQITTPAQLACVGRSAGGLLVGMCPATSSHTFPSVTSFVHVPSSSTADNLPFLSVHNALS